MFYQCRNPWSIPLGAPLVPLPGEGWGKSRGLGGSRLKVEALLREDRGSEELSSPWRRFAEVCVEEVEAAGSSPAPRSGRNRVCRREWASPRRNEWSEESLRTPPPCEASPQWKVAMGSAGQQSHQGGAQRPAGPQRDTGPVLHGSRAGPMAVAGAQDPQSSARPSRISVLPEAQGPLTGTPAGVRRTPPSASPALFQGHPMGPLWAQGPLQCPLGLGTLSAPPRAPGSSHPSPAQCPPGPPG